MPRDPRVQAYLESYAEPESHEVPTLSTSYAAIAAIPLRGEDELFSGLLDSLSNAAGSRSLAVAVVNAKEDDLYRESSILTVQALRAKSTQLSAEISVLPWSPSLDVLWVDRVSRPFGLKDGVGLARKMACDIAIKLWNEERVASSIVHTTDGDARVAPDYFNETALDLGGLGDKPAALLHRYIHLGAEDPSSAIALYDAWLRYYEEGLRHAGSPYAFPTIGSLIAFHPWAYAAVRGFPKREAGEDFYFLNKAAKIGRIGELSGKVALIDRPSQRVPFGTGQGTEKIRRLWDSRTDYTVHDPEVFECLQDWLKKSTEALSQESTDLKECFALRDFETLDRRLDLRAILETAAQRNSVKDRLRQFHTGFDAQKTLLFVHELANTRVPDIAVRHPDEIRRLTPTSWRQPQIHDSQSYRESSLPLSAL